MTMNAILDRAAQFADRYERPIAIAGAIWLAISCAYHVPFIPMPDIPFVTYQNAWIFSGGWNAVWWGFIHPAIDSRRAQKGAAQEGGDQKGGGNTGDDPQ